MEIMLVTDKLFPPCDTDVYFITGHHEFHKMITMTAK